MKKNLSPEELRKLQLIQIDMLKEFDRVCRENDIKYILAAGTLLGAVRYGKFIPWDDDIDVKMLRSEYEKFCLIANKNLNPDVFFQTAQTDEHYLWYYGKLRKHGTKMVRLGQETLKMHNGVFIDIFPCDSVPERKVAKGFRNAVATVSRKILYSRIGKAMAKTKLEKIWWTLVSYIPQGVSYNLFEMLQKMFPEEKNELVGCMGYHNGPDCKGLKKSWFTDVIEMKFEGEMYFVPRDWDGFLCHNYGEDYMTPPPENKRTGTANLSDYYFGE